MRDVFHRVQIPGSTPRLRRAICVAGALLVAWLVTAPVKADGPRDNLPDSVRQIPPPGVEVTAEQRQQLTRGLAQLEAQIQAIAKSKDADRVALLPDVQIFHRAVSDALTYSEFFKPGDIDKAAGLLAEGSRRAQLLGSGQSPWTTASGLVVRGFVSKLDGTVQPYGLVIPDSFHRGGGPYRCDLWFHGRGETLSEVNFLDQRMKQTGRIQPRETIVLHPYGRYSNAFKFAGEVDVLEALEHVQQNYPIDAERIAVRGFSMGGAGCWQMAVHYPDRFFAATPGAGFSETPEFLRFFQKETLDPAWFERTLWQWYDCPVYAVNLSNLPTIAYSGELDIQKQAADVMESALAGQDMQLVHLIGPNTKHAIHPQSLAEIESRLESLARIGRDRLPRRVRFVTPTLKYNRSFWVQLDQLDQHWKPGRIDASWESEGVVTVRTSGIQAFTLNMPAGTCPFDAQQTVAVRINGQELKTVRPGSDRSWQVQLAWQGDRWSVGVPESGLRKQHGLQGPIDDAFMDSFLFVAPTEESSNPRFDSWCRSELERAQVHWRQHFRGVARIKADTEVTDQDISQHNLILWGDPASNQLLKKLAPQLPIRWSADHIRLGDEGRQFSSADHALVMIYPNPQNPSRYIVLNSSFTYREYAYLNNARQVPMLPDWAVIGLDEAPGTQRPGKIVAADFFDEFWQLKTKGTTGSAR